MASDFVLYLTLGLEHIADIQAYDHMLFLIALCALFTVKDWKKVLILVTAFTIGHSITLALSVLDIVKINKDTIETLIPITIIITCIFNIVVALKFQKENRLTLHYLLAIAFGLIHGMGFANYLKALLGDSEGIVWQLFAFNIGIELGQIAIVLVYFGLYYLIVRITKVPHRSWVIGVSILAALVATSILFRL